MSHVRCVAYNVGASKAVDFTSADKWDSFNAGIICPMRISPRQGDGFRWE